MKTQIKQITEHVFTLNNLKIKLVISPRVDKLLFDLKMNGKWVNIGYTVNPNKIECYSFKDWVDNNEVKSVFQKACHILYQTK